MDYVLFGMGYGASLMLLGWALRTFGPQLKYRGTPQEGDINFLVEQRCWVRFVQGLGGVIAIAGTTMVLMTFVEVLVNPNDDTGGTISLAIWAFILVVVVAWCVMYISHYGLAGIWSRENGYGFRERKKPLPTNTRADGGSTAEVQPRQRLDRTGDDAIVPSSTEAHDEHFPDVEPFPDVATNEPTIEPDETEITDVQTVSGPVYDFGDGSDTTVPSDIGGRSEALRRLRERQARSRPTTL